MKDLDVRIRIAGGHVARITAVGRDGDDRARALAFLATIRPELEKIDRAAKLSATRSKEAEGTTHEL